MIEITMPRLSDTMQEGSITSWQVAPGDQVSPGDVLAEIETDKAVMDFEAYDSGRIAELLAEPGTAVAIGQPIALLDDGTDRPVAKRAEDRDDGPHDGPRPTKALVEGAVTDRSAAVPQPQMAASPLVRRMARDHGLDLGRIVGSGPGGRIIRVDVERALAERAGVSGGPGGEGPADARQSRRVPVSQLRRVLARRLTQAAQEIPVFTVTMAVRLDALTSLRAQMNQQLAASGQGKVSLNDLIVKAAALASREYPAVNASWAGDHILLHERVNVGIAVATERGLVVPVIKDANSKTPAQIGAESRSLAGLAASGELALEQMSGGTFTVSNLGMYGVEEFRAIINPPEASILAVGAARPELAMEGGEVSVREMMRLTLSCDHRLIDGALGAQFLSAVRRSLENPWSLIL
ncbi:MAG: 2-oxo acid dehydrogenase subunit E2 [Bifidobacteriaceae bacterium]|jgi:pyruvate dehydrogenase E2 component (dihydrolipoamide acetyltransferase)|nr:2-oxo acid dehydrogenase subunit E2 [Bifidobacteriaceae bacterium]